MKAIFYVFLFSEMNGVRSKYLCWRSYFEKYGIYICIISPAKLPFKFHRLLMFVRPIFMNWLVSKCVIRHNIFDPFFIIYIVFRGLIGKSTILEHHSDHISELRKRNIMGKIYSYIEIIFCRIAGVIIKEHICVSYDIAKIQLKYFRAGKFHVIENGVSFDEVERRRILEDINFNPNKPFEITITAGRFMGWHGLDLLMNMVINSSTEIVVNVVGDSGSYASNYLEYPNLKFHGSLSDLKKLRKIICNSNLCVDSLSLSSLGLVQSSSLKAKEYIALGKPILAEYISSDLWSEYTFIYNKETKIDDVVSWCLSLNNRLMMIESDLLYDSHLSPHSIALKYNNII